LPMETPENTVPTPTETQPTEPQPSVAQPSTSQPIAAPPTLIQEDIKTEEVDDTSTAVWIAEDTVSIPEDPLHVEATTATDESEDRRITDGPNNPAPTPTVVPSAAVVPVEIKTEDDDDSDIEIIESPAPSNIASQMQSPDKQRGGAIVKREETRRESMEMSSTTGQFESFNSNTCSSVLSISEVIPIRVFIFDGEVQRKKVLVEATSDTRICDLPLHPDLIGSIENALCEWSCDGDELKRVTVATLCGITAKRPIELVCTVKK
ncbi:hypothetical protein PFISCL1PPCAC_11956, partial [Pristionchus fissidentatus]